VARYRLRFLLQEFDLPRGATLIGRSADCHVTIEDPLVSREHARIVIDGDDAVFEDLGSRNGVKVNGTAIRSPAKLKDGDRLRIGTQELVFCRVGPTAAQPAKTTGFLRYCAKCRLPYPQELAACPACGATEQTDEETLSGQFGASSKHSWSVQLLVEVTDKALSLGRIPDAVRMLQRTKTQLEERMGSAGAVDNDQLGVLAVSACRVSVASGDPTWACWIVHVYGQLGLIPPEIVTESLAEVAQKHGGELRKPIEELVTKLRASAGVAVAPTASGVTSAPPPAADAAAFARLEMLHQALETSLQDGKLEADATLS
jgi:FHA domain